LEQHKRREPDVEIWQTIATALQGEDADKLSILDCVTASVFNRCQFDTFLASSEIAVSRFERAGRSDAGSFCMLRILERRTAKFVPVYIRHFVLLDWPSAGTVDRLARVNIIPYTTNDVECQCFGQTVFRFDRKVDIKPAHYKIVFVDDLVRPLILIKPVPGPDRCISRLIHFEGCLLGGFLPCKVSPSDP
jgi:hypothetical protein